MNAWLSSIRYNRAGKPVRATVRLGRRSFRIEWRDVCGDWAWFAPFMPELSPDQRGKVLSVITSIPTL